MNQRDWVRKVLDEAGISRREVISDLQVRYKSDVN